MEDLQSALKELEQGIDGTRYNEHHPEKLTAPIQPQTVKEFEQWFKAVSKKEYHTESHIRAILGEAVKAGRKGLYYDLPIEYTKENRPLTYGGIWQALVGV